MIIYLIYFAVILFATTVGALSGMGGGVIIKPVLDAVGAHALNSVNFYSSVSIFVMSIVSVIKQVRGGMRVSINSIFGIAVGSIVGGSLGNILFNYLLTFFSNQSSVQMVQIVITVILLALVLLYLRFEIKPLNLKNRIWPFAVGLFLGAVSTLLGIGGGPINVAMFIFVFGMPMKKAMVYALTAKFFAHFANLLTVFFNEGFTHYELNFLWAIVPAAILGGYLGSQLNQKSTNKKVNLYYRLVTLGVIILNIANAVGLIF